MQNPSFGSHPLLPVVQLTEGFRRKKFELVWNTRRKQMFRRCPMRALRRRNDEEILRPASRSPVSLTALPYRISIRSFGRHAIFGRVKQPNDE
jgi:hypothetical protein